MERRGFLKGVFGGITAAGLIVAAKPEEIAAFASPLARDVPILVDVPTVKREGLYSGEHLYNADGECVAVITEIRAHSPAINVTSAFDDIERYMAGLPTVEIRARGVSQVYLGPRGLSVSR